MTTLGTSDIDTRREELWTALELKLEVDGKFVQSWLSSQTWQSHFLHDTGETEKSASLS